MHLWRNVTSCVPAWRPCRGEMNITIRLSKVEYEVLKELQKKEKRYKKVLEEKVRSDLSKDYKGC